MASDPTVTERDMRTALIDAATQVFTARSFEAATTREIAAEAGVSEGSIYRYFASKEDLLFACFEELDPGPHAQLPPVVDVQAKPVEDQLVTAMTWLRDGVGRNYQLVGSIWGDAELRDKFVDFARRRGFHSPRGAITEWIAQGQRKGVFSSALEAEAMMVPLSSVVVASVLDTTLFSDPDKAFRVAAQVMARAFTP